MDGRINPRNLSVSKYKDDAKAFRNKIRSTKMATTMAVSTLRRPRPTYNTAREFGTSKVTVHHHTTNAKVLITL